MNVDHRGFSPLPETLHLIKLDATLPSDLKWEVDPPVNTLWELEFGEHVPRSLPTFQIGVRTFVETVWQRHREETLGVVLYRGGLPPYDIEILADMLHQLGALLPDEVAPFALFDLEAKGSYYGQLFSKELFSHIHLGFRSAPFGALKWGEELEPRYHSSRLGVLLPLRSKVMQDDTIDHCLEGVREEGFALSPYR